MNNSSESLKSIEEYLENSYTGARMLDDSETMLRISRALFALRSDIYEDIFLESVIENDIKHETKEIIKNIKINDDINRCQCCKQPINEPDKPFLKVCQKCANEFKF